MDSVVNSVEASFLSIYSDAEFVLACSSLCSCTFLKIGFGIPDTLTEQFCKLSSMLSLFESITLERLGYLGIAICEPVIWIVCAVFIIIVFRMQLKKNEAALQT